MQAQLRLLGGALGWRTAIGSQLALSPLTLVNWKGWRGIQWSSLLPSLVREYGGSAPHLFLIPLKGNDLDLIKGMAVVVQTKDYFAIVRRHWFRILLAWSTMIPRRASRNAMNLAAMNKVCKNTNHEIWQALEGGLNHYILHPCSFLALKLNLCNISVLCLSFEGGMLEII